MLAFEANEVWLDTALPESPDFEYNVRVAATLIEFLITTTGCSLRAGKARREPGAGEPARLAMLDILARVAAGEPVTPPQPHAIIITVPGAGFAVAPPPAAVVIVNDLWDNTGASADSIIRLSSLRLVRDDY